MTSEDLEAQEKGDITKMYRTLILILSLAVLGTFRMANAQGKQSFDGFTLVDKTGNIRKPADYRDLYQMLGSWTVLDPKDNQMHLVWASPGTAEYYRRNKKFADGTVLMKEIHGTDHAPMTTGDAHWATDTKVWFMLIKDSKGRYPNNPLWGDGWGWALFKADAPDKQVATDYKKDCLGCHQPAKADDWIYVKGYPVLHSSK
jgi:Cytochrome P460